MIVVVGSLCWGGERHAAPTGLAASIALATAAHGAKVELVGRIGDDDAGDSLLIALAARGVGHAAVLRDPARATMIQAGVAPFDEFQVDLADAAGGARDLAAGEGTADQALVGDGGPVLEAADVAMGLRYLADFAVLIAAVVPAEVMAVIVEATAYTGAHLIVLVAHEDGVPPGLPAEATALAVPTTDPGDAFVQLVTNYAIGLDAGATPADGFRAAAMASGWEGAPGD